MNEKGVKLNLKNINISVLSGLKYAGAEIVSFDKDDGHHGPVCLWIELCFSMTSFS